jgi:hypothetical protein
MGEQKKYSAAFEKNPSLQSAAFGSASIIVE